MKIGACRVTVLTSSSRVSIFDPWSMMKSGAALVSFLSIFGANLILRYAMLCPKSVSGMLVMRICLRNLAHIIPTIIIGDEPSL